MEQGSISLCAVGREIFEILNGNYIIMAVAAALRTSDTYPAKLRNIVVFGKTGAGKSTVSNKILESNSTDIVPPFNVSKHQVCLSEPKSTNAAMAVLKTNDGCQYLVKVIDTTGFCSTCGKSDSEIVKEIKQYIRDQMSDGINLVLFTCKHGRWTAEEQQTFDTISRTFKSELSSISALVVTGCDAYTEEEKKEVIDDITTAKPEVAKFMKKGIHPVGFPNVQKLKPALRPVYEQESKADQEALRRLVYESELRKLRAEILEDAFWDRIMSGDCKIL